MALTDLATIIVAETRKALYAKMLDVASALGLATESWEAGDPTRTLFDAVSRLLEAYEGGVVEAIKSGFAELATGASLTIVAEYVYGVTRTPAARATASVLLANTGALTYSWDADELVFVNSSTGATYRNQAAATLTGSSTVTVTVIADEAGTDSNAGVGEIDALQSPIAKISAASTTSAVGADEETDAALRARCLAKLGSLSPNGPADAYHYVATTSELTGSTETTRTRVRGDSSNGTVYLFIAGNSGLVSTGAQTAVEAACSTYATPLTVSLTVVRATNVTVPITYALWVYDTIAKTSAEIQADVSDALLEAFRLRPIGGDAGVIYRDWIVATILQAVAPYGYRCTLALPSGDVALVGSGPSDTIAEVAVVGTVTATAINLVAAP